MALDRGRQTLGCDLRRERRRVFGAGTETIPYRTNALPREMLENSGVGLLLTTGRVSRRGPRSPKMGLLKFIPRIAMAEPQVCQRRQSIFRVSTIGLSSR